ncbi:DUF7331 family protein [Halorubrum sp. SY-15]|jgi:hypothetical protein|uniref:DUF7331 family protein n=1 Tax=Halorubrum sp. SY-15 TaxID=3402277 RepID=UPI003EBDFE88
MSSTPRRDDPTHCSGTLQAAAVEVEAYEDDGNVVFFDAGNPLAWVESTQTIPLADAT